VRTLFTTLSSNTKRPLLRLRHLSNNNELSAVKAHTTAASDCQTPSGQIPGDEPEQGIDDYWAKEFKKSWVLRPEWKTPWEMSTNRSRIRAWRWRRAGWWWCIRLMVWYGMVSVDLYSAIVTKVSNALNLLVPREKPGFQALSKGLIVLLCAEVVRQRVPDHRAVHGLITTFVCMFVCLSVCLCSCAFTYRPVPRAVRGVCSTAPRTMASVSRRCTAAPVVSMRRYCSWLKTILTRFAS